MTRLTDMDGYPIYLLKPQSDTGIAFALIGVVLGLLIMGSVLAVFWPVISAWCEQAWADANKPLGPNDHGDPL